jgi:hypothetical protein
MLLTSLLKKLINLGIYIDRYLHFILNFKYNQKIYNYFIFNI